LLELPEQCKQSGLWSGISVLWTVTAKLLLEQTVLLEHNDEGFRCFVTDAD